MAVGLDCCYCCNILPSVRLVMCALLPSLTVTWYGLYDVAYLTTSTVIRHSPEKRSLQCRLGGHAVGCAVGAALLWSRFPYSTLMKEISTGHYMRVPLTDILMTLGGSSIASGTVSAGAQAACR